MLTRTHPAAAPLTPPPGARALYLGAGDKKLITSTEAALVITNARQQTARYPISRVARIVSSTVVDWSGAALALCLRQGISITWIDTDGQPLGTGYPQARGQISAATALILLLQAPDGPLRYQHWQRARRLDMLTRWAEQQPQNPMLPMTPQQWEAHKREWVYACDYTSHLPLALRGLCSAYVNAQLARHGLPPSLWGPQAQRIDLDDDLCELLWAEMNLHTGSLADHPQGSATATALFEHWSQRNASALLLHLHSLQRIAMQALAP
jgi:hypothetical protein